MTIKDFSIDGPLENANPYIEKMIKFWHRTKKKFIFFFINTRHQ